MGNRLTRAVGGVFLTIMIVKKTKPKKKPMTLEDFAVLIQKDLARMSSLLGRPTEAAEWNTRAAELRRLDRRSRANLQRRAAASALEPRHQRRARLFGAF